MPPVPRPAVVTLAAAMSGLYAAGVLWFGGTALTVLARTGGDGDPVEVRGMVFVGIAGLAGAGALVRGAVRTLAGRYTWTRVLLGVVLAVGVVGETADVIGTASGPELAVGAAVLVGAALPLVLLGTGPARWFADAGRSAPGPRRRR